jgi:hypothetical protein
MLTEPLLKWKTCTEQKPNKMDKLNKMALAKMQTMTPFSLPMQARVKQQRALPLSMEIPCEK